MNKAFNRELNAIYAWMSNEEAKIYDEAAELGKDINKDACKMIENEACEKIKKLKARYGIDN